MGLFSEMIIVIGRGHSGTRVISHTLAQSGVFMGRCNPAGDLVPGHTMYAACKVLGKVVNESGVGRLRSIDIPREFTDLIEEYLATILASDAVHKGFKIPEASLVYPWLVRMYPQAHYIYWIRDPRDCILGWHQTDNLQDFGVETPPITDERLRRAWSWMYQYDLVHRTPKPEHWIAVRFEDFILRQAESLKRLEEYLGLELFAIPVRTEPVGRWKTASGTTEFSFLREALLKYHYMEITQ